MHAIDLIGGECERRDKLELNNSKFQLCNKLFALVDSGLGLIEEPGGVG